jgi:glutathionylspermidine synthase
MAGNQELSNKRSPVQSFETMNAFYDFLERSTDSDPDFVKREIHYMSANCSREGLNYDVPMHPLFLPWELAEKYQRFGFLVKEVLYAILEVVSTASHSKAVAMKRVLRVDEEIDAILRADLRGRRGPGIIRPDTVLSHDGFKAHEFNVSWPGGISDADIIMKVLQENSLFKSFQNECLQQGLEFELNQIDSTVQLLREELVENSGIENPYIVLVHPRPLIPHEAGDVSLHQYLERSMREAGADVDFVFPDQVEYVGRSARFEGRKIDVVYRFFEWHHVVSDPGFLGFRKIFQAAMNGDLVVVNSFVSEVLSAKSVFEILWDDEFKDCFELSILEEIRQYIPKTYNLSKASDEELEMLIATQNSWVIKPVKGSSGMQVFLGKMVEDRGFWEHLLNEARKFDTMVAQEYVETPRMQVAEIQGQVLVQRPHYMDINPFYILDQMGNFFARWSHTYMTAQCAPGMGGMYPVVLEKNLTKSSEVFLSG